MKALGMWDRVTVHLNEPDPEGKEAGCFRSHVKGWNEALARGCEDALMVEEDLYFNEPVVNQSMANANAFVASGTPYDMFFLGYGIDFATHDGLLKPLINSSLITTSAAEYDNNKFQCVYRLHGWLCTQSYIISRAAMERWKDIKYINGKTEPIDVYLSHTQDRDRFFAVSPMMGFQRFHKPPPGEIAGGETGSPMETWKFVPGVVYSIYEPDIYGNAQITRPAACLAPPAAFSYNALPTAVQEFDEVSDPNQLAQVVNFLPQALQRLQYYDGPTSIYQFNVTVGAGIKKKVHTKAHAPNATAQQLLEIPGLDIDIDFTGFPWGLTNLSFADIFEAEGDI